MDIPARPGAGRPPFASLLAVLAVALALVALLAPGARAVDGIARAADALREGPVYVDPRVASRLPPGQAGAVADTIEAADAPVFVAVLPEGDDFDPPTVFHDLRAQVGLKGVYVVALGDRFAARADASVMSRGRVSDLVGDVERSTGDGDTRARITGFVEVAAQEARGTAPSSWDLGSGSGGSTGSNVPVLVGLLGLLVLLAGGALLSGRRRRRRQAQRERDQLETLRPVVDEDITAFGEELDRTDLAPSAPGTDDAMRADYGRALDSYEKAKVLMAAARRPPDVREVTRALEAGRFSLATLEARRAGKPLPEHRPPCFFDPRHGPSVRDVRWAPPGGAERDVPVCGADAVRLADGEEPMTRQVETPSGRRPYWEAGPAYGPWASGYFGAALLPGLLVGTMLGGSFGAPYGWGGQDGGAGGDGGDGGDGGAGGSDGGGFEPGDFGGFGGDGGGFGGGGGDFGGGF